jgi:hypothetical protein
VQFHSSLLQIEGLQVCFITNNWNGCYDDVSVASFHIVIFRICGSLLLDLFFMQTFVSEAPLNTLSPQVNTRIMDL